MAELQAATLSALVADATLSALATGGVYDAQTLGRKELEISDLQVGTNPMIQPAVFIRWTTETPMPPDVIEVYDAYCEIFFYQHEGYDIIRQMRARVYELLHRNRVTIDGPGPAYHFGFNWAGSVLESEDESLAGASMERDRYQSDLIRSNL